MRRIVEPDRLLGYLTSRRVIREVEVAATTGLSWILGRYPEVASRLHANLKQQHAVSTDGIVQWHAEHPTDDGGRADLAAVGADRAVLVRVEAKFGARLETSQLTSYLHVASSSRLVPVVVIYPHSRHIEVEGKLKDVRQSEPDAVLVPMTWDAIIETLLSDLPEGPARADVEQLRSLATAAQSFDVPPFPPGVAGEALAKRDDDVQAIAEGASRLANEVGDVWPYRNLSPGLDRGRYFALGDGPTNGAVGVRVGWVVDHPTEPIWLRFHSRTKGFSRVLAAWTERQDHFGGDQEHGHLFIPLHLPRDVGGERMVDLLQEQIKRICEQLIGAEPRTVGVATTDPATTPGSEPV